MIQLKHNISLLSNLKALISNLALVYATYALCRITFLLENWSAFSSVFSSGQLGNMIIGCLLFDTSAIFYTNALYVLLILFPLHLKEHNSCKLGVKVLFVFVNALCIIANLADAVYYKFSGSRTTSSIFSQFENESNITQIVFSTMIEKWYMTILAVVLVYLLWKFYYYPKSHVWFKKPKDKVVYYAVQSICLLVAIPIVVCGIRGGATKHVRPIAIINACKYVDRPSQVSLVVNTPFSIIRTIGKRVFVDPGYYSQSELNAIYSPVRCPADTIVPNGKNVVVLIVESFGREYIGSLNTSTGIADYRGFTPFLDSLIQQSVSFQPSFINGRQSIDAMPSILSSIPRFLEESFILTTASMNNLSSIAGELRKIGYETAFFHGADNGSMGFEGFALATGFEQYYGRTEYKQDSRFNGDKDFDGTWAIWDEEFLQYFVIKMNEMKQPFATSVFTATSHDPFVVPRRYQDVFKNSEGDNNPIHKCIEYTDYSLRRFFEAASRQPWFDNTLFVITGDHHNISSYPYYQTDLSVLSVPIIFYEPKADFKPQNRTCIAQHIDIMPTVLNYVGYNRPYVAFGKDLFHTPDSLSWAVNHRNGFYQFVSPEYVMQMSEDGEVKAVYNHKTDWFMNHNLKGTLGEAETDMERRLKAIIQSYMIRLSNNELIVP